MSTINHQQDGIPLLPCHPLQCTTCQGMDIIPNTDDPCPNDSWCQSYIGKAPDWYVCDLPKDHKGLHKTGSIIWDHLGNRHDSGR